MQDKFSPPTTLTYRYVIIGGAPKSGTTSLFRYLADHPEVCPSKRKETYFFARDFDFKGICNLDDTLKSFDTYFDHCGPQAKLRVEATPFTLYNQGAAKHIAALIPDVSLIFILRDPVERLFSNYRYSIQRMYSPPETTFMDFIEGQRASNKTVPNLLARGCYINYLRPFIDTLGTDQIRVLFFEDLLVNPAAELHQLSDALGIDSDFYTSFNFQTHNRTLTMRYPGLNRIVMKLEPIVGHLREDTKRVPFLNKRVETILRAGSSTYRTINSLPFGEEAHMSSEAIDYLTDYYRPYSESLAQELGRDLPWKSINATINQGINPE